MSIIISTGDNVHVFLCPKQDENPNGSIETSTNQLSGTHKDRHI